MAKKLLVLSVIAAMFLLAACSSSSTTSSSSSSSPSASKASDSTEKPAATDGAKKISGKLELFTYRDDLLNTWYPKVLAEFKQQYPDVEVSLSTSKNFNPDLKVKMAANDMPDLVTLNAPEYEIQQLATNLLPLDDVFPELVSDWQGNDVNKAPDGKTYALTYGLLTYGVTYNKKIFAGLGLQPPKTLDELIAAGKKIKASGKIGYVGDGKPLWTYQVYLPLAKYFEIDYQAYEKQMIASDAPFTADSAWGKTFDVIKKITDANIFEEDTGSYDWEPFKKDFAAGKSGMWYGWSSIMKFLYGDGSVITADDLGLVPFPYDNTGGPYKTLYNADWSLAISKNTKNPEAAKALYKFLMDAKYEDYAKTTGVFSARKSVTIKNPAFEEFDSYHPVKVFDTPDLPEFKVLSDKAQVTVYGEMEAVSVGKPVDQLFNEMNAKWKKAKKNY